MTMWCNGEKISLSVNGAGFLVYLNGKNEFSTHQKSIPDGVDQVQKVQPQSIQKKTWRNSCINQAQVIIY